MLASEHIRNLLVAGGMREAASPFMDWDIWIGKQTTSIDRCITIYDAGGLAANPKWLLDYPSVQVKVRGNSNDYKVAYEKAKQARDLVLGVPSYTAANGDRIVQVNSIGDVGHTGWDDSQRPEFVFNLRMIIEPVFTANTHREPL